jgi:ABC-type Mn2+/Zn2+ transport system permease subunit
MLEILKYSFFQKALIWWILISLISGIIGVFIVMRKEANITHSISNFLFLWIATSLFFSWNYYFFAFLFWIIWSLLIYLVESTKFVTKESTKEIISQSWMALWIFVIWFLQNLTLDINNFLFWSILFISNIDIYIITVLLFILYILFFYFWKNFLAIIINEDIARTRWLKINLYNLIFLLFLSLFIWVSIKIFWILLIWAFLVIPANIWKILWNSIKSVFILSVIFSLLSVIIGLFVSHLLWTSSSSSIVLFLILSFFGSILYRKSK